VLGDFDKSTVENPLENMTDSYIPSSANEQSPTGFIIVGIILVIFIISATALLSVYVMHESKLKRRRR
jgi:hypothetical protein